MKVTERPALRSLNTFGVPATAQLLLELEHEEDVLNLPVFDPQRDLVLGGGSNIVFVNDVPGNVLLNRIRGITVVAENETSCDVEVGAGESWHGLVCWAVSRELSGLENLALIPGLAGAAPIQNIGAYGTELSSVLASVAAWDWKRMTWSVLDAAQCGFGYRDSIFKSTQPGRYLITSIRLRLRKQFSPVIEYAGLHECLIESGVTKPTVSDVFNAVVSLRRKKLPDPEVAGNAGSFFKNPQLSLDRWEYLRSRFPAMPAWPEGDDRIKISAAWMIEQCNLKGYCRDNVGVSNRHALVLVNQGKATGAAVWQLAQYVQQEVATRFGITLEPEPLIYRNGGF